VVKEGFDFLFADDPEYEDLIAEIYFDGEFVALVSQEAGFDSLDIQLHSRKDGEPWRFKVNELEGALQKAKSRLWELRKNAERNEPHS
jgi:hypothetical protein